LRRLRIGTCSRGSTNWLALSGSNVGNYPSVRLVLIAVAVKRRVAADRGNGICGTSCFRKPSASGLAEAMS
jgi:hypothetical protein